MEVGQKLNLQYTVKPSDTAKALAISEKDDFPEVFATSRMIAVMELAAARLMQPLLNKGELSVGINVNVNHLAATPVGAEVEVVAEYTGQLGKIYSFQVDVYDMGGLAGSGKHTRAIVDAIRLVTGANKRTAI